MSDSKINNILNILKKLNINQEKLNFKQISPDIIQNFEYIITKIYDKLNYFTMKMLEE